jgi:hypothetical protein
MYPVCFVNYLTGLYPPLFVPLWRGIKGEEASISTIIISNFDITPAILFKTSSSVNRTI